MGAIQTRFSTFFGTRIMLAVTTRQTGFAAEDKALDYLSKQGLKLVTRNFNCRVGEIDLIMHDKNYLVFIEVRARASQNFGGGIASITPSKRQKIIKTSSFYMVKHKIADKFPLRFDVISLDSKTGIITWIKDAFGADY